MGVAAHNRGSKIVAREADRLMPSVLDRADREATKEEITRLRAQVAKLERDLSRARRCIAAERYAREKRVSDLKSDLSRSDAAVSTLCRIAFPSDG